MCFIFITAPSVKWGTLNASLLCRNTNIELKLWGGGANEHSNQTGSSICNYTVQERVSKNYNFKVKTVYRYSGCIYGRAVQLQEGVTTNYIFKVKTVYRYPGYIYGRTVQSLMQVDYNFFFTKLQNYKIYVRTLNSTMHDASQTQTRINTFWDQRGVRFRSCLPFSSSSFNIWSTNKQIKNNKNKKK